MTTNQQNHRSTSPTATLDIKEEEPRDTRLRHIVVVSHYRENIEWLWKLPDNDTIDKIIVYHKGNRLDLIPKLHPLIETRTLPNIGREGHTILYHLLSEYSSYTSLDKPTRITFLQGNPLEHSPRLYDLFRKTGDWKSIQALGYCFDSMTPPPKVMKLLPPDYTVLGIDLDANHHVPVEWTDNGISYLQQKYRKQASYLRERVHPYGILMDFMVKSQVYEILEPILKNYIRGSRVIIPMTYGGLFSVTSDLITSNPLELYQKLYNGLFRSGDNQGGLEGYLLERCWLLIFKHSL